MSSQTSCFQHVVLLEIPDLESVDHFPILAAVIGILLALLENEMSTFAGKYYNFKGENFFPFTCRVYFDRRVLLY